MPLFDTNGCVEREEGSVIVEECPEELRKASCKMCRLLGKIKHPSATDTLIGYVEPRDSEFGNLMFESTSQGIGLSKDLMPRLSLSETDPETDNATFRTPFPKIIDFEEVKGWIKACIRDHGIACTPQRQYPIQGLRVIDCHQLTVVSAPTVCAYVALSYVWGQVSESIRMKESNLPQKLPQTVADAVIFTKCLGYRYLWIDKYVSLITL